MPAEGAGALGDRYLSVTPDSPEARGLMWRESSRSCRGAKVVADARVFVRVDAETESDRLTRVDRDEIPDRSLRKAVDSRVERWTCGERVSRETAAGFDPLAAWAAFAVRRLTSGWRRSRASSDSELPTASAALRSMLRATPSGRAIVISRPSTRTDLRDSRVSVMVAPPRSRISSLDGASARASMRFCDAMLWVTA